MSSSSSALREEIKGALAQAGLTKVPPEILSQCVAIATTLHVSPQQMAECWEAFSLNRNLQELSDRWMPSYKNELIKQSERGAELLLNLPNNNPNSTATASAAKVDGGGAVMTTVTRSDTNTNKKRDSHGLHMITPPAKKGTPTTPQAAAALEGFKTSSSSSKTSHSGRSRVSLSPGPRKDASASSGSTSTSTNHPYLERTNVGTVVYTYNPQNLEAAATTAASGKAAAPKLHTGSSAYAANVSQSYRHMFTTVDERATALEQHLVELEACMRTKFGIVEVASSSNNENQNENEHNNNKELESGTTATAERASSFEPSSSGIAPLEAVGVPRQEKVCCIGRICNSAHEGRINETSILLEGSRYSSGGQRVQVDLSYLKNDKAFSHSLFPGQIVAVEGMNCTGRKLVAHRICEGAAGEAQKSTVQRLLRTYYPTDDDTAVEVGGNGNNDQPLKIVAACGPFTTSDNLEYAPLLDLLNQVKTEQPDVVILCGPFVDLKHEIVSSGTVTLPAGDMNISVPYETLFANRISEMIEELFIAFKQENSNEELMTQFVLLPSLDDATAEWVYPQPPFADRIPRGKVLDIPGGDGIESGTLGLQHVETAARDDDDDDDDNIQQPASRRRRQNRPRHYKRIHCVSNPCTFCINEVVFGVTSTDVLFHMSADETNANLESGSRLGRLCQHLLQQQSYYPLFPAALHKANLDLKQMDRWRMPCQPDVLIVPSTLKPFAQTVLERTVAVNPGRLTMGRLAGTYATMEIHPVKRETLERAAAGGDEVELFHEVQDRTRIEIKRI